MAEACRRAHLTPAVFHRWKAGKSSMAIKNLDAIMTVLRVTAEARPVTAGDNR